MPSYAKNVANSNVRDSPCFGCWSQLAAGRHRSVLWLVCSWPMCSRRHQASKSSAWVSPGRQWWCTMPLFLKSTHNQTRAWCAVITAVEQCLFALVARTAWGFQSIPSSCICGPWEEVSGWSFKWMLLSPPAGRADPSPTALPRPPIAAALHCRWKGCSRSCGCFNACSCFVALILQKAPRRHSLLHSWGPAGSRMGVKSGDSCCASESKWNTHWLQQTTECGDSVWAFVSCLLSCCIFISLIIPLLTSHCSVLDVNNCDVGTRKDLFLTPGKREKRCQKSQFLECYFLYRVSGETCAQCENSHCGLSQVPHPHLHEHPLSLLWRLLEPSLYPRFCWLLLSSPLSVW